MPLSEQQKRLLLIESGYDPSKFYFNEQDNGVYEKEEVLAQGKVSPPIINPESPLAPITPQPKYSPLGTATRHAAAEVLPAGAGVGTAAAIAALLAPETMGGSLLA